MEREPGNRPGNETPQTERPALRGREPADARTLPESQSAGTAAARVAAP